MMDVESGSYWSHVTGKALTGRHEGKRLEVLPAVQTTWKEWHKKYPGTKVLEKNKAIRSSSYEKYFKDPNRTGIFRAFYLKDRLPGKTLVVGVTCGVHAVAVTEKKLREQSLLQTQLDTMNVLFVRTGSAGVRTFDSAGYSFEQSASAKEDIYSDRQTGSLWDLGRGLCIDGPAKGQHLRELNNTVAFWFAWSGFYPNTAVID